MKRHCTFIAFIVAMCATHASAVVWQTAPPVTAAWTNATTVDTALAMSVSDYSSVAVTIRATSTMTAGSIIFEASDDGANWYALSLGRSDTGGFESTFALSVTNKMWQGSIGGGISNFRVRLNPVIAGSGTLNLRIEASAAPAAPPQRVYVAQKATYSFATVAKTATAAGTGPFWSLCGSASKIVRLQQLIIGGTVATAAVYGDVELTKTSTATSAGTATALTNVPHDSANAAATVALNNFYTALGTAGAGVGKIGSQGAVFPITGTVAAQQAQAIFDWSNRQEAEAPVLRGATQCVEASFGTTTTNAPTLTVQGFYTEE